jgi:hypothetical protein
VYYPERTDLYWPDREALTRVENGSYTVDGYAEKKGLPRGNNNVDGRLHFSDAVTAELRAMNYERVKDPSPGDNVIYVEEDGPTIYGTVRVTKFQYIFKPNRGKEFMLDKRGEGIDYFLLKHRGFAARTQKLRENDLRGGPRRRDTRFKGGVRSRRASRRSVTQR